MSTVVRKPNAKFLLRSYFLYFVHHANRACAETQTRSSRSTYLLAETPISSDVCIFYRALLGEITTVKYRVIFRGNLQFVGYRKK